ncbi:LOW QUALITY PROTEIN: uncharacterized protein [Drosophila tropicalis]|uniref:LOW QUALITY PROTEIN: uncharacterized protein n=1 Tax=Drosophila tropicalis TaxID=46794 RepID=UPI0035ABAD0D
MIERRILVVLLVGLVTIQAHFPEYCAECEQEVWEQVPCSDVPTTTTESTVTTTTSPITTTTSRPAPPTSTTSRTTTTPFYPTPTYTTPSPLPYTTPSAYKKCYCECKQGCKEFCRKVTVSDPKKQITQISSTGDYAPGGQLEFTHIHQRKYFPKTYQKYGNNNNNYGNGANSVVNVPKPYPLVYNEPAVAPAPAPALPAAPNHAPNYTLEELANLLSTAYGGNGGGTRKDYPAPSANHAPNYTLEELAHLLSSAYGNRKGYPVKPQAKPSVYYSPVYKLQPVQPIKSQAVPVRGQLATAAAATSGGLAIAKAKTPYDEKISVATSAPIYESSTPPYPHLEEPKLYSHTESPYPQIPSQTISYTESYPSHTETYTESYTESYPSQTQAYPTQTESYSIPIPEQEPQAQAKSYAGGEPNPNKPSSTFDLAIDNYLKDFGYGNQVRGYGDY